MFFLLEVGTEELPADFVDSAIVQWEQLIPFSLEEELLTPKSITFYGTPRRLAVLIAGLPDQQNDRTKTIKGPSAQVAFKDGKPTKSAEGFSRKQKIKIADLEIRPTEKGDFVFIEKKIKGQPTSEILQKLIPTWITKLEGRRFMRWGNGDLRFPRPIRWLVILCDDQVLPLQLANAENTLISNRISYGHRILHPAPVTIPHASQYRETLQTVCVEVDRAYRRKTIEKEVNTMAKKLKGTSDITSDLLTEVTNLVEYPTAIIGKFDDEFLELPSEVITTVMMTHQRYFAVKNSQGSLLSNFITISNGDRTKSEIIATGNARVIRARLADAQFFYHADCSQPFDSFLPKLETVIFQEELGTMKDKVNRIITLCQQITQQLELTQQKYKEIEMTAMLCKADLVTQMVYEFPELQGIMGQKYALISGESEAVAQGIFEHYLPRGADDIMPQSLTGQVVGLADRLDTLVGILGLGLIPTGSSDPFALKRAANGVINIIWKAQLGINLTKLLDQGSQNFVAIHSHKKSPLAKLEDFFVQRLQTLLQDELKIDYDLINAVLGQDDSEFRKRALQNLLDVRDRAKFLQKIRNNGQLDDIYETVNRSTRLASQGNLGFLELDPRKVVIYKLFQEDSEKLFYQKLVDLLPKTFSAKSQQNYQLLVEALVEITPTVNEFFDGNNSVLVMDKDTKIRQNRLNLLGILRNHGRILADFGAIIKR
ncbi:glycine--tRNA ligase subunit beta [cyanobacterium endosymbiont of Epithemia turgida]|uniref:glycine--tRNA ligase subunit beta n=1 Tax=cyanobacterium endosymbiont of Epithemia turgida TaxID=718217 RepID=UPI0004D0EC09|nr:glycine--tRNA ligase subunit beta [cyanobacterium endosymbiont of Epithemia turgida]BAP17699.1 glycyl-tRNA synthetase subunit beta [cyanobacterium endosymbiont of Epithemia turgida isolate EtSB Lake Yunoko]